MCSCAGASRSRPACRRGSRRARAARRSSRCSACGLRGLAAVELGVGPLEALGLAAVDLAAVAPAFVDHDRPHAGLDQRLRGAHAGRAGADDHDARCLRSSGAARAATRSAERLTQVGRHRPVRGRRARQHRHAGLHRRRAGAQPLAAFASRPSSPGMRPSGRSRRAGRRRTRCRARAGRASAAATSSVSPASAWRRLAVDARARSAGRPVSARRTKRAAECSGHAQRRLQR